MSRLRFTALVVAVVAGPAHAQDGCSGELEQVQRQEITAQNLLTGGNTCRGLQEKLKVDRAYAAFYRRCLPGIQGQLQAQEWAKSAAGVESAIPMACGGAGSLYGPGRRF